MGSNKYKNLRVPEELGGLLSPTCLLFHSILVQHQSLHAEQDGGEDAFICGREDNSQGAVEFDKSADDQRHAQCVDDVVQDEDRPDRFTQQP